LTGCAIAFNLIWRHLARAELLVAGLRPEFVRDVTVRYLLGLAAGSTSIAVSRPDRCANQCVVTP
jgi:hypothetical protein